MDIDYVRPAVGVGVDAGSHQVPHVLAVLVTGQRGIVALNRSYFKKEENLQDI